MNFIYTYQNKTKNEAGVCITKKTNLRSTNIWDDGSDF